MLNMPNFNETLRREPPKDLEAERNLLGALMQDGTLLSVITEAIGTLNEEEFASDRNRVIYSTIIKRSATTDDFNPRVRQSHLAQLFKKNAWLAQNHVTKTTQDC